VFQLSSLLERTEPPTSFSIDRGLFTSFVHPFILLFLFLRCLFCASFPPLLSLSPIASPPTYSLSIPRFTVPDHGNITPAQRAAFARHCWPELPDIVARVRDIRQDWESRFKDEHPPSWMRRVLAHLGFSWGAMDEGWRLNKVYVLTNGDRAWWEEVRSALRKEGWDVRGSGEMDFESEGVEAEAEGEDQRERRRRRRESEKIVGQAVDMEMAARAEVFVGNGVSLPWLLLMAQCFPLFSHPLPDDPR